MNKITSAIVFVVLAALVTGSSIIILGNSAYAKQDNRGQQIKSEIPRYGPGFGDNIKTEICGDDGCGDNGGLGQFRGNPND